MTPLRRRCMISCYKDEQRSPTSAQLLHGIIRFTRTTHYATASACIEGCCDWLRVYVCMSVCMCLCDLSKREREREREREHQQSPVFHCTACHLARRQQAKWPSIIVFALTPAGTVLLISVICRRVLSVASHRSVCRKDRAGTDW